MDYDMKRLQRVAFTEYID